MAGKDQELRQAVHQAKVEDSGGEYKFGWLDATVAYPEAPKMTVHCFEDLETLLVPLFRINSLCELIYEYTKLLHQLDTVWYIGSKADGYKFTDRYNFGGVTEGEITWNEDLIGPKWANYIQCGRHNDFKDFDSFVVETIGETNGGEDSVYFMSAHDLACAEELLFAFGSHIKKEIIRIRMRDQFQCDRYFLFGTSADAWWVLVFVQGDLRFPSQWRSIDKIE
mmetsp:Transcript_27674/g.38643  ORF Transcript_27674/g.38643 Transcript_27674/m.38643 type:complete len:223 (-) Transcript_27674:206-874(-)